jgi:hypothetical protein
MEHRFWQWSIALLLCVSVAGRNPKPKTEKPSKAPKNLRRTQTERIHFPTLILSPAQTLHPLLQPLPAHRRSGVARPRCRKSPQIRLSRAAFG